MAAMRNLAPNVTGHVTAERAALASAIESHAAAVAHVRATEAEGARMSGGVWEAQTAVLEAQAVLTDLQGVTTRSPGGVMLASPAEDQAREVLASAQAALDVARAARDALKGRLPDAEQLRDDAAQRRTQAARAVVLAESASYAIELGREVEALQRQTFAKAEALGWLVRFGAVPVITTIGGNYGQAVDDTICTALFRHERAVRPHAVVDRWHLAAAVFDDAPWDAALAELERDAAAPLPL